MLPPARHPWRGAPFALLCIFSLLLPASLLAETSATAILPPEAKILEAAQTFRVEVEQAYGEAGAIDLPFASVVETMLRLGGLQEKPEGAVDLVVQVTATGTALSREYEDSRHDGALVAHFTGAELAGRFTLVSAAQGQVSVAFSGTVEPPLMIHESSETPGEAPFHRPFGAFVESFTGVVANALGPRPLRAVLRLETTDAVCAAAPELQRCAAVHLAAIGGATALPTLLTALESPDENRRAAAARGLAVLQNSETIPRLLALLNDGDDEVPAMEKDGRWSVVIAADSAFEPVEENDGALQARPEILSALRALYRPDQRPLFAAALGDKGSVLRRIGAALVLGHSKDPQALEPLLAAAEFDPDSLVRAGAANALGQLGDKRAARVLQTMAKSSDEGPDKYAAYSALSVLTPEWSPPERAPEEQPATEDSDGDSPKAGDDPPSRDPENASSAASTDSAANHAPSP